MSKLAWWKWLTLGILLYVIVGGLLLPVPRKAILNETIRNLYFHVPMWFAMIAQLSKSAYYAVRYMNTGDERYDFRSVENANTGIMFGILGMLTGMIWAQYTWGSWWSADPKQLGSAAGLMVYFAYAILRGSFQDDMQRARVSAVYNVFAFPIFIVLIIVMPRFLPSLHPGADGNPGFNIYDSDDIMKLVFYPAVVGWILLGKWMTDLNFNIKLLYQKLENQLDKQV